jgi:Histidine phosphatase superfamily (branch 2)
MLVVAVRSVCRVIATRDIRGSSGISGVSSATIRTRDVSSSSSSGASAGPRSLKRVRVQVVHRHGDRTPITPLNDEAYWEQQLISPLTLDKIALGTRIVVDPDAPPNTHNANGRGPFGKLTELGLYQLVQLGMTLRETLIGDVDASVRDERGRTFYPYLDRDLPPSSLRIFSTNFARTIQSVQGVLVGMYPDGLDGDSPAGADATTGAVPIDVRHTHWMIPDPQPRRTHEQTALEKALVQRPHMVQREQELFPLAVRSTRVLDDLLAPDARQASFGLASSRRQTTTAVDDGADPPLSWTQLAEITKCLAVRKLLPTGLSSADQEAISQHAAWTWFQAFSHPRLAHLAMGKLTQSMMDYFEHDDSDGGSVRSKEAGTKLTIWSAHDSTLICLLCAFRLEQPAVWPEYGSYLMVELLQDTDHPQDRYVRFSLNGQMLRSKWGSSSSGNTQGDDEPSELIPFHVLRQNLSNQEKIAASL